ncbi:MAG: cobalamin B12-binding domain-containing protein, partial [Deltaproteobacteria bacterium]|nr:cobalamin B12-binding domain-containing protein [Deltaproteobacteria bacterium]
MKLLFLTPPMRNWVRWGQKHIACNPLHAHLAAFVRERKVADVDALDCRALELSQEEMLERIRALAPDAVFLGTRLVTDGGASPVVFNLEAMSALKEAFPRLITILGGLGVSAIPKEIIGLAPQLDYLLIGEAEWTLVELLEELKKDAPSLREIRGLAYRDNDEVQLTPPRPPMQNLSALPMPAYDLFPMSRYIGFSRIEHYNEAVTSRGCEGACSFCYEWGLIDPRRSGDFFLHRTRSGKLVADEMELLNKIHGVKALNFMDDDFNSDRQKMLDLLDELEKRDLDIQWFFMGRARNLMRDADLIPRLRRPRHRHRRHLYERLLGRRRGENQIPLPHRRRDRSGRRRADAVDADAGLAGLAPGLARHADRNPRPGKLVCDSHGHAHPPSVQKRAGGDFGVGQPRFFQPSRAHRTHPQRLQLALRVEEIRDLPGRRRAARPVESRAWVCFASHVSEPNRRRLIDTKFINPVSLAKPRGYTHGVKTSGASVLLFLGGQVAWDQEGRLVGGGDIVAQFDKALENL